MKKILLLLCTLLIAAQPLTEARVDQRLVEIQSAYDQNIKTIQSNANTIQNLQQANITLERKNLQLDGFYSAFTEMKQAFADTSKPDTTNVQE